MRNSWKMLMVVAVAIVFLVAVAFMVRTVATAAPNRLARTLYALAAVLGTMAPALYALAAIQ